MRPCHRDGIAVTASAGWCPTVLGRIGSESAGCRRTHPGQPALASRYLSLLLSDAAEEAPPAEVCVASWGFEVSASPVAPDPLRPGRCDPAPVGRWSEVLDASC